MKPGTQFFTRFIVLILVLSAVIVPLNQSDAQGPIDESSISTAPPQAPDTGLAPSRAYSGGPGYDSGWVSLGQNEAKTLVHNLGSSAEYYVVDMQYRNSGVEGINQRYYGGMDLGIYPSVGHVVDDRVGAYWRSLTNTSIVVYRRPEDSYAEQVRIRIWNDSLPDYDSGWVSLTVDASQTLTHNLGGNVNDYVVDMEYQSASSGINQRYFGGCDFGAKNTLGSVDNRLGAYWRTLTTSQITVYRRPEDTYAEQVRIRIWVRPKATYDTGWFSLSTNSSMTLSHNIGGNVEDYQVVMDFKAADVNGINNRAYGGMDVGVLPSPGLAENNRVGAYWRTLTPAYITVYRRPDDIYAPQIRIRIFRFWQVPTPNYDSGWLSLGTNTSTILTHNLGGDANTYMVDFQYKSQTVDGINQRYFGGSDFGDSVDVGLPNNRVGAYWRNLTSTNITVYRRSEDTYAPQVRVRIWRAPKPDYDSGWVTLATNTATLLSHNLRGNYQTDYFVSFDYRNSLDSINQRYYGGADFGTLPSYGGSNNTRTGAYWRSLDGDSVVVYRRPDDVFASDVRLRIWRMQPPDYSSGWVSLSQSQAKDLAHNLGGVPDAYLVQMYQWDTDVANTLNQRHYGGADFGNLPPTGYAENDRVGAYWRSLTGQSLTVYRRPEDGFADFVLVRIWNYNSRVFLPVVTK
jgi:hypothetical protein